MPFLAFRGSECPSWAPGQLPSREETSMCQGPCPCCMELPELSCCWPVSRRFLLPAVPTPPQVPQVPGFSSLAPSEVRRAGVVGVMAGFPQRN